jgi:F1F0 ATPase subunit 2
MLVSALVRISVAFGCFHLVAEGSWQRLLLCLLGFVVARAVVSRRVCSARRFARSPEILHAP